MALVNHDHRIHLPDDLHERRFGRVCQQQLAVVEVFRERDEVPVLLVDLLVVLLRGIGADGCVAEHAHAQVLHHVRRLEVLGIQQLFLRIDVHRPAEVAVQPLPVRMIRIRQIGDRLREDRVARDEPYDELRLARRKTVEYRLYGRRGKERLAAARRHLYAHVRNAAQIVEVWSYPQTHSFRRPVIPPRGVDPACPVERDKIGFDVVENITLVSLEFHHHILSCHSRMFIRP